MMVLVWLSGVNFGIAIILIAHGMLEIAAIAILLSLINGLMAYCWASRLEGR